MNSKAYDQRQADTGDYTGRCWKCGSSDVWDDMTMYGCRRCGMVRSNEPVIAVRHEGRAHEDE